jgi:hypothetical protein
MVLSVQIVSRTTGARPSGAFRVQKGVMGIGRLDWFVMFCIEDVSAA